MDERYIRSYILYGAIQLSYIHIALIPCTTFWNFLYLREKTYERRNRSFYVEPSVPVEGRKNRYLMYADVESMLHVLAYATSV